MSQKSGEPLLRMKEDRTYHILVADDQPDNVFLLQMLLRKQPNFKVTAVTNGLEAVEFVQRAEVDLVLMDIMMPVMDGLEAVASIRRMKERMDLPILMVTTLNDTENIVKSFAAGANDYVGKPIEWHALRARIVSALSLSESARRERQLLENQQALNQRLKEFSFAVAHDIRNPLAHIRLLCEAVREGLLPFTEAAAQIGELAAKTYNFLDGILEHSAYGKTRDAAAVDLARLLDDVLQFLGASIEESGAVVERGELPVLQGSRHLLFQLLLNLVGNAIKYRAPARPPRVTVSAMDEADGVVVSVRDNGRGIARDEIDLVQQPLKRGRNSSGTPGSGLGLSLSKNIMAECGGQLQLTSEEGIGTEIRLHFPARMKLKA